MKYTVTKSYVILLGHTHYGQVCSLEVELDARDLHIIEEYTKEPLNYSVRQAVHKWTIFNSGDFSVVLDFYYDLEIDGETVIGDWESTENELLYQTTVPEYYWEE